jgi:hypothetical protein
MGQAKFCAMAGAGKKYPAAMIAVEKLIMVHELSKRFDILVYDSSHKPWMMIECKAQTVPLTEKVLLQVLRYNIAVPGSVPGHY